MTATLAILGGSFGVSGCGLFGQSDADACVSTSEYFAEVAWPRVLGSVCIECHSPDGPAVEELAKFQLQPPGYPGFLEANLEHTETFAKTEFEGVSVLLRKPLGELDHGGGQRVKKGTPEYEALEKLVQMIQEGDSCKEKEKSVAFDDVNLLGPVATFRKASLHLAYRLPTSEETARLSEEGEDALPSLIDGLMTEDAFFDRIEDLFNDELLTDRYLRYTGYAVNQLDEDMYPESGEPWELLEDDALREAINRAIAREPLDFISYLVRNERPFTDLVAGDYMVVNPYSAPYFNADVSFEDPNNEEEWVEVPRQAYIDGQLRKIPGAGVMTSPMFLNRFPTTPTNRNRHRARMVLDFFLGTDILEIGERPLDPTQSSRYSNPTRDDPSCNSCHEIIDPIAGAFQKFDDNDQEEYVPNREWYRDMKAPGFGQEEMTIEDFDVAPTWLGKRVADDPRFVYAMVKLVYEGIVGRPPRAYPEDLDSENYDQKFQAWQDQQQVLEKIGSQFVDSDYNLKTIVRGVVLSPYYRAENLAEKPGKKRKIALGELGTGRLSTPMLLARKIEAVMGRPWVRGWDDRDKLLADFRILYGGIDSDTVTQRLQVPNGVMAGVGWRMANEVSCMAVPLDFWRSADQRILMRHASLEDVPETESGDTVPAAVERIKKNIQFLHAHILGEDAALDSAAVERTYGLFLEAWREGQELMAAEDNDVSDWLTWSCQVRDDPATGEELPEDQRFQQDPDYTVRAWMAVMAYLLADYRFLYE